MNCDSPRFQRSSCQILSSSLSASFHLSVPDLHFRSSLSLSLSAGLFLFLSFFLTPACCFTTLAPSLTSPHLGHVLRFLLYLYLHSLLLSTRLQAHQQGARKEPTPTNLNVRNLRGFKNSALDPKGPELNHHLFKSSSRRVKCRAKMRNTEAISFSVTADR